MGLTIRQKRRVAAEVRLQLVAAFPDCFAGKRQPKKPLKIGIRKDIEARMPDLDGQRLAIALADYTFGPTYQTSMVEGAQRVDLDGNPAGTVTQKDEHYAKGKLKRFQRWKNNQKAA